MDDGFSRDLWIQEPGENGRCLLPLLGFLLDLLTASPRELVKLCLPVVVRKPPFGPDISFLFQLEQSRIESSVVEG